MSIFPAVHISRSLIWPFLMNFLRHILRFIMVHKKISYSKKKIWTRIPWNMGKLKIAKWNWFSCTIKIIYNMAPGPVYCVIFVCLFRNCNHALRQSFDRYRNDGGMISMQHKIREMGFNINRTLICMEMVTPQLVRYNPFH